LPAVLPPTDPGSLDKLIVRGPGARSSSSVGNLPRLRQVALAAHDLKRIAGELQETFGWPEPFHDPGVGEFGLENAVFAAGDTFVEVVSPVKPGTTAGRYLDRRGGDTGYMAIFQVADIQSARKRIADFGIRVVWQIDLPDIAGTHLHPKDVPGAIVSIDWAKPPESWRWAGPAWTGKASPAGHDGVKEIVIEDKDPVACAARWSAALGIPVETIEGLAAIQLDNAEQLLWFTAINSDREGGIAEVVLQGDSEIDTVIGGVRFRSESAR